MLITTINVHKMQASLTELISLVSAGTEVILTDGITPLARLVPFASSTTSRIAGLNAGAIQASDDFDKPLPDDFWMNGT